jgi:transcription elongation factor-like protein
VKARERKTPIASPSLPTPLSLTKLSGNALDNFGKCRLRAEGVLALAGQTKPTFLFVYAIPAGHAIIAPHGCCKSMNKLPMTAAGYLALENELTHRIRVERPRLIQRIQEAIATWIRALRVTS